MPSVDEVQEALTNVIDPELGLDFVELGLVYEIEVEGGEVFITFTLTSPGCPIGPQVSEQMEEFVGELGGVSRVYPKMVFTPPWTPEMMRLARPGAMVAFAKQDAVSDGYAAAARAARAGHFEAVLRLAGGRAAVFHEQTIAFARALPE